MLTGMIQAWIIQQRVELIPHPVNALGHAAELFLPSPSAGAEPLVLAMLRKGSREEEVFAGVPSPEPEVATWRQRRQALEANMAPLPAADVRRACDVWLEACSADVSAAAPGLMRRVKTLAKLAEVEKQVRKRAKEGF